MAKVIAEIGINHNGQIDIALNMIRMAKDAGADMVKFQMRDVDTVYAGQLDNPRLDGNPYGWGTVGEQKRGLEFSLDQYKVVDGYCKDLGVPWFASCWDLKSMAMAEENFDWPAHKIASPMVTHESFVKAVALTGRHIFLSTGGTSTKKIIQALDWIAEVSTTFLGNTPEITMMHCVSIYPCPDSVVNLGCIEYVKSMAWGDVGYSGHEKGIGPSIMALGLGVDWIERHVTLNQSMYGSDQSASLEIHDLKTICDVAKQADAILGDGIKRIHPEEAVNMKKLRYWEK